MENALKMFEKEWIFDYVKIKEDLSGAAADLHSLELYDSLMI